jgi:CDP-glucose 4,6-dehydratase
MHYLVTGHTGFKGAWLTLWLTSQGHKVSGISLDPLEGSLFEIAKVSELMEKDLRIDIRNAEKTIKAIQEIAPDVVFHLAAQPLVRESYKDPRGTIETNVMGTLNVIEGVSKTPSVKAHVVITTDKVYRNVNQEAGYVESDPLGGEDPYSASKAMADILTHSWISSFGGPATAIVRAGNVIGGGDVSPDRLLPDLINAFSAGQIPTLRYPESVRPWQHVLDCLNGYIQISEALLAKTDIGEINIGPGKESFVTVGTVTELVGQLFGASKSWNLEGEAQPHEAGLLALDAAKANKLLGWEDKLKFTDALGWTVQWHKDIASGKDARETTLNQIKEFINS